VSRRIVTIALIVLAAGSGSCRGIHLEEEVESAVVLRGNPERGVAVIEQSNCGSCHTIPGVRGAHGMAAAPLTWFSRRTFIAGEVPNTAENLVSWIKSPQSIEARTAMPAVGLSDQQARDVAAYLYTVR
jgi:mono/diheme cytochrome c family protein